jgi:predicted membrane metal-binding protein
MYTDKDYSDAGTALKRFIVWFSQFLLALLVAVVYALLSRTEWLIYVSAAVLTAGAIFLWGNFGVRIFFWRRFLIDMQNGMERQAEGVIASIDAQETNKEGLEFRALRLITGDETDKAGGRLLYVDSTRFPLPAGPGQKVVCRLYGNYIKDMALQEDK